MADLPGRAAAGGAERLVAQRAQQRGQHPQVQLAPEGAVDRGRHQVPVHRAVPVSQHAHRAPRRRVFRLDIAEHLCVGTSGERHDVPVHVRHVLHRRSREAPHLAQDAAGAAVGAVVEADVVRVVVARYLVVGGDDVPGVGVAGPEHLLEGHEAGPLVLVRPSRHGQPRVRHAADGQPAPVQVLDVAVHVYGDEVVGRVHPVPQGLVQLVDAARAQHALQALDGRVRAVRGRVPEGDPVALLGAAGYDRAVTRDSDVYLDVLAASDLQHLVADLDLPPLVAVLAERPRTVPEALDVHVLVVGHGVGDAPRDAGVVTEVREAREPGERQAYRVELGAGDVVLVVDVGRVEPPVRVAGHQRSTRSGPGAGQRPVVAARIGLAHRADGLLEVGEVRQRVVSGAVVLRGRRHDEQIAPVARQQLCRPARTERVQQLRPPQLRLEDAHQDVPTLEDGQAVPRLPPLRLVFYQRELGGQRPGVDEGVDSGRVGVQHRPRLVVQVLVVEPDRRTDLEPAHLDVLLQGVGARVLGPSAVGQQSVVLHVPQPVLGRREGLPEEGVAGGAGPHVGNPVGVAVDVDRALQPVHGRGPGELRDCLLEALPGQCHSILLHTSGMGSRLRGNDGYSGLPGNDGVGKPADAVQASG